MRRLVDGFPAGDDCIVSRSMVSSSFCFAVCASVNADDGYALSSRSVAASVWCHPVCCTVLLIEPFRVLIRRFSVAMVAVSGLVDDDEPMLHIFVAHRRRF
ncbi:putative knottin, scorpion toxin-like superfamily [Helianthus annuus]|nr:putative knottin, scorpion toxin-like superfamily [Helianthus annuus]KAJ0687933.1 putative knottin, scorpion toxin-like superfamily [Helianthus annuus]